MPKIKKAKKKTKLIFQSPRGMADILPSDQPIWRAILEKAREIAEFYNFSKIETPMLESTDLFVRTIGEETEVVEKQMFSFRTKGGDSLTIRPEGTAPVARAFIQNGLANLGLPSKLYYEGPMLRYERPQRGRGRSFHQFGIEVFGEADPICDAQVILVAFSILKELKLKNFNIQINTIGCRNCRSYWQQRLKSFYQARLNYLCEDCKARLKVNPLRLLDCSNPDCLALKEEAPFILDNLCSACNNHFKEVLEFVEELKLPYVLNNYLVRGLDYYNRTVFEFWLEDTGFLGANLPPSRFSLGGGGRYDYLIETIGGRGTPAIGVALGLERIVEVIKAKNISYPKKNPKVFLVQIGDSAKKQALPLIEEFRKAKIALNERLGKNSIKAQLQAANKTGASFVLIFGQKEAFEDHIILRDMRSGVQETIPLEKIIPKLKKRLK